MHFLKKLNVYSGLPRTIYILFIVRIINSMGNFVYPFLTLFLIKRIGLSTKEAGVYFTISALAQAAGVLTGGKLTDHLGRKKLFILFQGFSGLCFIPCVFLGNSMIIPIFLILGGAFSAAAQPANTAMVTDITPKENRKQAFSLLYLGINIGFAVGPTIAGFLFKNHTNWIFLGNSISIMISLTLVTLFISDTMPDRGEVEHSREVLSDESAEEGSAVIALLKRPKLSLFLIGKTINQFVYSSIGFVIPIQMSRVFGDSLGPKNYGMMMSFTGVVIIIFTTLIIKLTMKVKPIMNISIASLFYAVGFGMLGYINAFILYFLSAFLFTVGEILEATNSGVYIANNSPINYRGRFNAIIPLVTGLGSTLGPLIFGKTMDVVGLRDLWIMCFALEIISSLFMKWVDFKFSYKNSYSG